MNGKNSTKFSFQQTHPISARHRLRRFILIADRISSVATQAEQRRGADLILLRIITEVRIGSADSKSKLDLKLLFGQEIVRPIRCRRRGGGGEGGGGGGGYSSRRRIGGGRAHRRLRGRCPMIGSTGGR